MRKIMFDTNAFSSLVKLGNNWMDFLKRCEKECEFYVTKDQVEEIAKIPDSKVEVRISHLLCLCKMRPYIVSSVMRLGEGRLGFSILPNKTSSDTYEGLLSETGRNYKDALIGETAKREGCVLVTNDKDFISKLKKEGNPTMTFEEFMDSIISM